MQPARIPAPRRGRARAADLDQPIAAALVMVVQLLVKGITQRLQPERRSFRGSKR